MFSMLHAHRLKKIGETGDEARIIIAIGNLCSS